MCTRFAFIFSESSYFNLKFGTKQSKIGWNFAEHAQWLPKAKISGPVDDRRLDVSKNALKCNFRPKCFQILNDAIIILDIYGSKESWY